VCFTCLGPICLFCVFVFWCIFSLFCVVSTGAFSHRGLQHTMPYTLPSRPSIRSFTWWGLETSSWSSSHSLDRPTPQRHWICSWQPLQTGHSTGPWWSDATARAGYAMTTTSRRRRDVIYTLIHCKQLAHLHCSAHCKNFSRQTEVARKKCQQRQNVITQMSNNIETECLN